MRSEFADYFNHDEHADEYDLDVRREDDPIRTGYRSLLSWIGERISPGSVVLDLGSGTGNTIEALPRDCRVTAVDVSVRMTNHAKAKLKDRTVTYIVSDILEYVTEAPIRGFDAIVSTYTLHHLAPGERELLFSRIHDEAPPNARILFGDLMYKDTADRTRIIEKYRHIRPELPDVLEDEFFWNIELTSAMLARLGWSPTWTRFSDLSWAVQIA